MILASPEVADQRQQRPDLTAEVRKVSRVDTRRAVAFGQLLHRLEVVLPVPTAHDERRDRSRNTDSMSSETFRACFVNV